MTLDELRERLSALDRQLLTLVAERQSLSRQVAEVKRAAGRPTRDFRRERFEDGPAVARADAESARRRFASGHVGLHEPSVA